MTPSVAGVHVSDLVESQGRTTEGEAEQEMILEVVPLMSMVVEGLIMVTDVALERM